MSQEHTNAVAGPSTSRSSPPPESSTSQLFLSPPAPPKTHPTYLSSTQDLLARFHLLPAYDTYVRPFTAPAESGLDQVPAAPAAPGANGPLDKGKGKEVEAVPVTSGPDGGDGEDDEGGRGMKKNRNNYKHLIKGIPGKHSLKKDEYLSTMMLIPPKQRIAITPFDARTQREAFTVSLEGLKGWNTSTLVLESAQAREDRKRRKEAKRLQKFQAQAAYAASLAHPQPIPAPQPVSATSPSFNRPPQKTVSNGTPRPGSATLIPRPSSAIAVSSTQRPSSTAPRPGSATTKSAVARPGSTVPRPGSVKPALPPVQVPTGKVATPLRTGTPLRNATTITPTSATNPYPVLMDVDKRGMKRERDDMPPSVVNGFGASNVNMNGNNGVITAHSPKAIINAKAGTAGIRPRPIKKQRMDMQGQARDVTVTQQPTPQGV